MIISPANSELQLNYRFFIPSYLRFLQSFMMTLWGSFGVQKLQGKLKNWFYWPRSFGDVKQWVK